jgi:dihydroxyacid dehydratase/phosphogluconate dehydratase
LVAPYETDCDKTVPGFSVAVRRASTPIMNVPVEPAGTTWVKVYEQVPSGLQVDPVAVSVT